MVRIFLIPFILFIVSCTTLQDTYNKPHSAVFLHPYASVWKAALLALQQYPLQVEHMDSGQIETDYIRGYTAWAPPKGSIDRILNRRYKIKVFLERGKSKSGEDSAVRIHIIKSEYINTDFIQQDNPIKSDGIEENVILYNISRELSLIKQRKQFHEQKQIRKKSKSDPENEDEEESYVL